MLDGVGVNPCFLKVGELTVDEAGDLGGSGYSPLVRAEYEVRANFGLKQFCNLRHSTNKFYRNAHFFQYIGLVQIKNGYPVATPL